MSDFNNFKKVNQPVITPYSLECLGDEIIGAGLSTSSSAAWPTANAAAYVPFLIYYPYVAKLMFWINTATVGTNNVDVGIYNSAGVKLVSSGSVLTAGATTVQNTDITDTLLLPGLYYMAMAVDGTTDTFFYLQSGTTAPVPRALGVYQEAAAFNLPATATFAGSTGAFIPLVGITGKTIV